MVYKKRKEMAYKKRKIKKRKLHLKISGIEAIRRKKGKRKVYIENREKEEEKRKIL